MNQEQPGNIKTLQLGDREITLIGTAHVSHESVEDVERIIQELKPDTVCVELCHKRYESLRNPDLWKNMDIVRVVKEGKAPILMLNLIMASFQKKMGDKLGVTPGAEMIKAIEMAEKFDAEIVLADREVSTTLKRATGGLSLWQKFKFIGQMLGGLLGDADIEEEEIEGLKDGDALTEIIEAFAKDMPDIKRTLIDERDQYLAAKITEAPGKKIVAVVGAGHMPGIQKLIGEKADLKKLDELPPPGHLGTVLKWGIPMGVIAMVAYGFFQMDSNVSFEMIKRWVLANGVLSAVGALLAGGHIVTVLSAFVAAPITSLNPTIAAGWVSGLTEAWVRKPKVSDFESLSTDITTLKGFRTNEITKILLVVVLSNVGSMLGTFLAIPLMSALL